MKQWEIRFEGIVQGVGFRPTVFQIATRLGISGEVSNGVEGVRIHFHATEVEAQIFYQTLLNNPPPISHITHHQLKQTSYRSSFFDSFQIIDSQAVGTKKLLFTPDYALCEACRSELWQPSDRRYGYPFITCTQCGPRFSIITQLPYDRPWTTMEPFEMCPTCLKEYNNPLDRRHFSQTNSCPDCGISLSLFTKETKKHTVEADQALQSRIHQHWEKGEIVAIKGIGGFLLTCDAQNPEAIAELRRRKKRPAKPFALMYPSLESMEAYDLTEAEQQALSSNIAPIVLVKKAADSNLAEGIADGLREVGIMLPYAPLLEWLLRPYGKPIIATSGNISRSPIFFREREEPNLLALADVVLSHNRKIEVPQDDSVVRFTPKHQRRIIIRRSRGLVPGYFLENLSLPTDHICALGADMKSSIGFLHEGNVYLSQYLGDLSDFDAQTQLIYVFDYMKKVLGNETKILLHDLHPSYESTVLARQLSTVYRIPKPRQGFQHHKAHFAAILAEHHLLFSAEAVEPVLGIIWDGTGYGEDGNIWGGESFVYHNRQMERVGHLSYFPILGGDKMAREPRLSALSLLPEEPLCLEKFSAIEQALYQKLHQKEGIQTSSIGRLFDAVASIVAGVDVQTFEGEAAMKLEAMAREYVEGNQATPSAYPIVFENQVIDASHLLRTIVREIQAGVAPQEVSARFHYSLPAIVRQVANDLKLSTIAFSGGVLQNAVLVDALIDELGEDFQLCFHKQLSPNDENIAFGQLMLYLLSTTKL